jgi:hypothetical protein
MQQNNEFSDAKHCELVGSKMPSSRDMTPEGKVNDEGVVGSTAAQTASYHRPV